MKILTNAISWLAEDHGPNLYQKWTKNVIGDGVGADILKQK